MNTFDFIFKEMGFLILKRLFVKYEYLCIVRTSMTRPIQRLSTHSAVVLRGDGMLDIHSIYSQDRGPEVTDLNQKEQETASVDMGKVRYLLR